MAITQEKKIQMLEKLPDGNFAIKYPETKASQVKFENGSTVESHLLEAATEDKAGHIKLSDIPFPTKDDVGLSNVDDVKQMPLAGGDFAGIVKAQSNTSYATKQVRNITLSTLNASGGDAGDIWFKYV